MLKLSFHYGIGRYLLCLSLLASFISNNTFTNAQLASQNLAQKLRFRVISPNSSTDLQAGNKFLITWSSPPDVFNKDDLVDITLKSFVKPTVGSQQQFNNYIGQAQASVGSFDWVVTDNNTVFSIPQKQISAHQLTVRVFTGKYAFKCTANSELFSIKPKPLLPPAGREKEDFQGKFDPNLDDPSTSNAPETTGIQSASTATRRTTSSPPPSSSGTNLDPSTKITSVEGEPTFSTSLKLPPSTATDNLKLTSTAHGPNPTSTETKNDDDATDSPKAKKSINKYIPLLLGLLIPIFALLAFTTYCMVRRKRAKAAMIPRHAQFPFSPGKKEGVRSEMQKPVVLRNCSNPAYRFEEEEGMYVPKTAEQTVGSEWSAFERERRTGRANLSRDMPRVEEHLGGTQPPEKVGEELGKARKDRIFTTKGQYGRGGSDLIGGSEPETTFTGFMGDIREPTTNSTARSIFIAPLIVQPRTVTDTRRRKKQPSSESIASGYASSTYSLHDADNGGASNHHHNNNNITISSPTIQQIDLERPHYQQLPRAYDWEADLPQPNTTNPFSDSQVLGSPTDQPIQMNYFTQAYEPSSPSAPESEYEMSLYEDYIAEGSQTMH